MLFQPNFVTRRCDINIARSQRNVLRFTIVKPRHSLVRNGKTSVLRNVNHRRMLPIHSIALRTNVHQLCVVPGNVSKRAIVVTFAVRVELFAKVEAGKGHRSTGVLFFH